MELTRISPVKTILAFETSGPILSVALGTRKGKVSEARAERRFQHSENLIPLIGRLLKKERLRLEAIDALAINRGPGSFTGLRIGFSLLKGLLAARKRACYGALSLDMMAHPIDLPEGTRLGVVLDARREKIYTRFYQRRKGEWVAEQKLELLSLPELIRRLQTSTWLVGDALLRYREALEESSPLRLHFLAPGRATPSAATLVQWFQTEDPRLRALQSPRDFLPLYLRASEAEEKRKERMVFG